jgi:hypothetical protein
MKKLVASMILIAGLALSGTSSACDLCAIYRADEAKESTPGFNVGVFEQFTHFGTLQKNGREIPNTADQYMDSSITQLFAGYQFERFGVQMNFPYIYRAFRRTGSKGIDNDVSAGLGDISFIGNFRAYEHLTPDTIFIWTLIGGVKFPTGSGDRIKEEKSESLPAPGFPESGIHGHDLALGSGSYDGIVGTTAAFHWDRFFTIAGIQYAVRTRGAYGYRYANDLSFHVKPGYFLYVSHESTVGMQFAVTGEAKGKDVFRGNKAVDTAVTGLFLGPEFSYTWKEKMSADLGAEFPVLLHNTSLQAVPDYKLRAAVNVRF